MPRKTSREILLIVGDICTLFLALGIGTAVNRMVDATSPRLSTLGDAYWPLFLIWMVIFYVCELYNILDLTRVMLLLKRIGAALGLMIITGVIYFYVLPFSSITPKTDLVVIIICATLLLVAWRFLLARVFAQYLKSGVLFVGSQPLALELADTLRNHPHLGLSPVIHATNPEDAEQALTRFKTIRTVILAERSEDIDEAMLSYLRRGYRLMDLGEAYETYLMRIPVAFVDAAWIVHKLQLRATILSTAFEETLGRLLALIAIIIFSPVMLGIIIAIKLDDGGPILYSHDRVGKLGKTFRLYKFRSMSIDAEKHGARWAQTNDPSVTRVGRITRKLHIDELAQMFNILRGDITLVGPRPERPEFVEQLEKDIPHYALRHIVKPGFTGWAQIKFRYARSVMDSQEKFQYDLYYIKNKSIALDLGIIAKTIQIIVTH